MALDSFQGPAAMDRVEAEGIVKFKRSQRTAILFHHHIGELEDFLGSQAWPKKEKDETRLIASLLVASDTIENGINIFKKIFFRNTYNVESPKDTLVWLKKSGIQEEYLDVLCKIFFDAGYLMVAGLPLDLKGLS